MKKIQVTFNKKDVLNAYLCFISSTFEIEPQLFPVYIQNIFELFDIGKGNWLLIKLVKIVKKLYQFNKIIKYEPRLLKKLSPKYL